MRIFGVDPGSARTGYGCIETDGTRHRVVVCGALSVPARTPFPDKLRSIHARLCELLERHEPGAVAVEDLFHAKNVRSAIKLGQVKGAVLLAASQARLPVTEYTPTQVKQAVVGYGGAEKEQVRDMVTLLLGLSEAPSPLDVSDALAVAVCHAQARTLDDHVSEDPGRDAAQPRSWRQFRPAGRESGR